MRAGDAAKRRAETSAGGVARERGARVDRANGWARANSPQANATGHNKPAAAKHFAQAIRAAA